MIQIQYDQITCAYFFNGEGGALSKVDKNEPTKNFAMPMKDK